jgi:hypothetical protein
LEAIASWTTERKDCSERSVFGVFGTTCFSGVPWLHPVANITSVTAIPKHIKAFVFIWDCPYRLAPTTVASLFDDSIAAPEGDQLLPDSNKQAFACHWGCDPVCNTTQN